MTPLRRARPCGDGDARAAVRRHRSARAPPRRVGDGCLRRRLRASSACASSRRPRAGSASSSRRSSFFECYGSAGFAALEDVLAAARAAGLLVIADAKRGDIGTTMDAYAQAWLTPGSPLEADAMTVNPFLGVGRSRGHVRPRRARTARACSSSPRRAIPMPFTAQRAGPAPSGETVSAAIIREVSAAQRRHDAGRAVGEPRLRRRRDRGLDGCRAPARSRRSRRSSLRGSVIRVPNRTTSARASATWRKR